MLKLKTKNQVTRIVNNIVAACKDITKLNKTGYGYIYLASGFIAHYDLHGFIAHYSNASLWNNIHRNYKQNMWLNFKPGEQNYEYYMQKAAIYTSIVEELNRIQEAEESWDRAHFQMEL